MNEVFTIKNIISLLVTSGVSKVISDAIDSTAPENVRFSAKILRKIGAISLGWFIGEWAGEQVEKLYDTTEASIKEIKEKVNSVVENADGIETNPIEEFVSE